MYTNTTAQMPQERQPRFSQYKRSKSTPVFHTLRCVCNYTVFGLLKEQCKIRINYECPAQMAV